ncbi:3' terminal RNA ribose 2'-O-methyltransferase Hen1 [Inquilinus limosus]|uniref:3' terminal RNA ribose 2'-O-methyltransferase Hen1 n=1 Tax=Inquilinus limosus TaxID=171674 RepID=UPI0003F7EC4D|nr:3' terminal RNA ribose 2'-O-methyltransferase Hen1 [Inquilinus limosus]
MFLSISTTHRPATDLGFLLHKHPDRVHETELPFGKAHLFYPEAAEARCEAALLLEVDPVGLVRGRGSGEGMIDQYVNDRPYAASSFLSVALIRTLKTAMAGVSKGRPELAAAPMPLEARISPLPARGGETLVRQLFEPLGWSVHVEPVGGPDGGTAPRYLTLTLSGTARLSALLNHLYVLIPVLDDDKHYWVGEDEVAKLLARGEGWLEDHPARELIVRRYLVHRRSLARLALARLVPEAAAEDAGESAGSREEALETPIRLHDQRLATVTAVLKAKGAKVVADLGCGEGKLLALLARERWVDRLIGVDASTRDLERAQRHLKLGQPGGPPEGRITLLHGALTYRDRRWSEADAAALIEVIEHLDPDRLPALTRVVFGEARPRIVVVTTPNADYNVLFPTLGTGSFRHADHRFEWGRAEFRAWAEAVAGAHGYAAEIDGIGPADAVHGAPTQMAVFTR